MSEQTKAPDGRNFAEEKKLIKISKASLLRLPSYLRYLYYKDAEGEISVSAAEAAKHLGLSDVQVRKDFAEVCSVSGRPRMGFEIKRLIRDMESFLGFDNVTEAVLVGAGQLGKTLLGYSGFSGYGLNIVAAFDIDPKACCTAVCGKKILPMEKLEGTVKRAHIHIGIITVPAAEAQSVCNRLLSAGVLAIWNFAPVQLAAPPDIPVKNEDMAASLALLSKQLKEALNNRPPEKKL